MRKEKRGNWPFALIWLAQLGVELLTAVSILRLNMLPEGYFLVLAGGLGLLLLLTGLILRPFGGGRKAPGAFRRGVGCVLALALIVGCGFAWRVVSRVNALMDGITQEDTQTLQVSMAVYVPAEDQAQSIADAREYVFAALADYEQERTQQTLDQLCNALGQKVPVMYFATLEELINALDQGQADALIFNSNYLALLEDTEAYADLPGRLRVLHTEIIQETLPPETVPPTTEETVATDPTQETQPPFSITTHPFIVYISGSDTRDYYLSTSRSDVNILAVVNPVTKLVLLINTPRDTWIRNPAGNGAWDKLTHCGNNGVACSIGALEDLYDIDVRYHAQINFTGVETLVDAIGGVDVYAEYGFDALGKYWISQGWNHLNGEQALAFARDRYHHADGDHARGRNQMKVIKAVLQKATSGTTIIENYAGILSSVEGMFRTNLTAQEMGELVKMQLGDLASWNIVTYALTGEGASAITYSMPGLYCYVMYPYESRVTYATELVQRVMEGQILTDADMTPPQS